MGLFEKGTQMHSDLLDALRAKLGRKSPNNVIYSECLRVIEELIAENKRLEAQIVGEKWRAESNGLETD